MAMTSTAPPTSLSTRTPYRFTVAEYHKMGDAGIFTEDDRVELIEGEVLVMSPIHRPHYSRVDRLNALFVRAAGDSAVVSIQNPVTLDDHTEPQPDLLLLRYRADFYADADHTAADVLLIVEIADSSVAYDMRDKAAIYARNGLPEYWVENVSADWVVVHREPGPDGYGSIQTLRRGATIRLVSLPEVEIAIGDLLG